jgi:hypothetical protein
MAGFVITFSSLSEPMLFVWHLEGSSSRLPLSRLLETCAKREQCTCCCVLAGASTQAPEAGNFWQRQAMAVPADLSDPYLKKWVKPQINPFLFQVGAFDVGSTAVLRLTG